MQEISVNKKYLPKMTINSRAENIFKAKTVLMVIKVTPLDGCVVIEL